VVSRGQRLNSKCSNVVQSGVILRRPVAVGNTGNPLCVFGACHPEISGHANETVVERK
jgi:hypothetical protein